MCKIYPSISHKKLWKNKYQTQCGYGNCHSFTATGMAEAYISQEFDKKLNLHETYIFKKHYFRNGKSAVLENHIKQNKKNAQQGRKYNKSYGEGNFIPNSYNLLKKHGAFYEMFFSGDFHTGAESIECVRKASKDVYNYISDCKKENKPIKESEIESICNQAKKALAEVEDDLSRKKKKQIDTVKNYLKNSQMIYHPKRGKADILNTLRNQPIAVSVNKYQKNVLGKKPVIDIHANHALIIAGYDCNSDSFIMRNSWGSAYEKVSANKLLENFNNAYILK